MFTNLCTKHCAFTHIWSICMYIIRTALRTVLSTLVVFVLGWSRIRGSQGQSWAPWCRVQRWQGKQTWNLDTFLDLNLRKLSADTATFTTLWVLTYVSNTLTKGLWWLCFLNVSVRLIYSKNLFSGQWGAAWDSRSSRCSWFRTSRRKGLNSNILTTES